jgi:putative membrane protein
MGLMMLVFIALVAWVAWAVFRSGSDGRQPTALDIVEQRFARGEIDEDELRRRREALLGGSSQG